MRKIIFLLSIIFLIQTKVQAQMDTIKIENTLKKVVDAYKNQSFSDLEELLFSKENYLELAIAMRQRHISNSKDFDKIFKELSKDLEYDFNQKIKNIEEKGESWENIRFEGFVFETEEIMIGNEMKPKGTLIDTHIRISFKEKRYTIIGVQLWLFGDDYKIKGDEIRGVFEIDLDTYISADDMYLDELEDN